jgi:hypothetical protein
MVSNLPREFERIWQSAAQVIGVVHQQYTSSTKAVHKQYNSSTIAQAGVLAWVVAGVS